MLSSLGVNFRFCFRSGAEFCAFFLMLTFGFSLSPSLEGMDVVIEICFLRGRASVKKMQVKGTGSIYIQKHVNAC